MVVKDLIDNDKGGWNLDLLNNILHHEDVEEVLRVSVLTNGDEDALVW